MLFYISLILLFYAYFSMIKKMYVNDSSLNVSINSNILSIISAIVTLFFAESYEILVLSFFGMIGSLLSLLFNILLKHKHKEPLYQETFSSLYFSGAFSFIMIYGLAQAIKSYHSKVKTVNVSAKSYSLFLFSSSVNIYYSINIFVFLSAVITSILYVYIIYRIFYPQLKTHS